MVGKPKNLFSLTRATLDLGGCGKRFRRSFLASRALAWCCCGLILAALAPGLTAFAQETMEESTDEPEQDADSGYRYLLKDVSTSVSSKGLKRTRMHHRIEIQKQQAVEEVGDVSIPYNAYRSEARVIKAFTQTPDGRTVPLKSDAVHDLTPEEVSSCQMYTDVHQLMFSMPALSKGAIIDYEVEIEEKKPVMPGEFWVSEFLDAGVQVCTSRVSVAFPAKREVQLVTTNLPARALVSDRTNGAVRTLTWELRDAPRIEYEPGMPPYASVRAQVHLTSVKSWQQVEAWYAGLAQKPLQPDAEIQAQARQLVAGLTNQLDQIQALYRHASRDVRYVGVELGRSAYEPHPPRETLQNKYGDCKDKAALLVSLLKAAGIPAHIAIVRPNQEGAVDQRLPGPDQFNHAIVYVPRPQGDLWIDATVPFGEVTEQPYHLDDVDALVVGLPGKTFVHIPVPDETHSVHRLIFDLDVHYGGLCTVREIQQYAGRAACSERLYRSRLDTDKVRKQLEHNLTSGRGYGRLLNYSFTNPTNDCEPVTVEFVYDSDTFLTATKSGFCIRFDAAELRHRLDVPRPSPTSVRKHKRLYPWVSHRAHTEEIVCRLHLAPGYELARTPPETHKDLPQGKAEMLFSNSAGVPCLTLRVISRPARLQPQELPEVAQQVDNAISRVRATLEIEDTANVLMREHRYAKAETDMVDAARHSTNSIDAILRLGLYYKIVGRINQSQRALEKAIALSPQDPRGYDLLADTWSGWWGLPGEGLDRAAMMAVYDRALTNVPVRAWTLERKAAICLITPSGRHEATDRLDEAEGYYKELLKADAQSYRGLLGLGEVNRLRGHYDEAEDYYRKAARAKPGEIEPRAGLWVSMAYAGRAEEAWNAMSEYYGPGQQLGTEAARVAALLMTTRHYEAAAALYDRLVETAPRPDVVQKLTRLMRKAEKMKRPSYDTFFDDSTPEAAAQTFLIASMMEDTNRLHRCLSPAVSREDVTRLIQTQTALIKSAVASLDTNYLVDFALAAFDVSKRTLDNGDIEVRLDASKSGVAAFSLAGSVATVQVQPVSNRWQVLTTGDPDIDSATLARLALDALDHSNTTQAVAWQTRLAELACHPARGRRIPALAAHLQEAAFTNDTLRVNAWAGMALATTRDRADIVRGAACLENVVAACPDDAQIKIFLACVEFQLANLRKAAAILDSINISKLAAPEQLAQLAGLQITLEKLDAADKAIARLREVAPDNEQILLLQAQALAYRGQYAKAAQTSAQLRERSKLDSPFAIPAECMAASRSGNPAALHELIEHWREPEKPIAAYRPAISSTCLALGLTDEASEQIAIMVAEGGRNVDALIRYAEIALVRGDTAEARHLVAIAHQVVKHSAESGQHRSLGIVHLALGDHAEAARAYREEGTHLVAHYSGYSLCMSALASRLAGDTPTAGATLQQAAAVQGDNDWPRLAIQYVSGAISEEEFRRAPERTTATPLMRASRTCEVNCIVALLKESNHDLPGALAAYQASLATQSVSDVEYLIARLAVQRLQPKTAPEGNGAK